MTKEQAQTRLRAILNEIVVSDDPRGIAVATLRDRIYIAANDLARACVAEALAQEWAVLDGPEFGYGKLTPVQQDLYTVGFNNGSKAAWEQARAEALAKPKVLLERLYAGLRWALDYGDLSVSTDNPMHRRVHLAAIEACEEAATLLLAGKGDTHDAISGMANGEGSGEGSVRCV